MAAVKLSEVVQAIMCGSDMAKTYIDADTGETALITDELTSYVDGDAEVNDDVPIWLADEVVKVRRVLDAPNCVLIPDQRSLGGYRMLVDFCHQHISDNDRERVLDAIRGRGAFRIFKSMVYELNLWKVWEQFREDAYTASAIQWLKEKKVPFVDDREPREEPIPPKVVEPIEGEVSAAPTSPRIQITYCTQCRWMLRAAWLAQELLTTFEKELGEVALRPGSGGVFDVRVGDDLIWSRRETGRFPEAKELKQLVRDRVAPEKDLRHSEKR